MLEPGSSDFPARGPMRSFCLSKCSPDSGVKTMILFPDFRWNVMQHRRNGARRLTVALSLLFCVLPCWTVVSAQTIRGHVVSADSTRTVPGVIVVLRDSSNADVARTLATGDGSFLLRVRIAGLYRIRALRIGFRPVEFGPYRMGLSEDVRVLLRLTDVPISLAAMSVTGRNECLAREEGGETTLVLWEEARKALTATLLTRTDLAPVATIASYERASDVRTGQLRSQQVHRQRGTSTRPYASPLTPEQYAARGYTEEDGTGTVYRAPDADVLLSESFAADHCFHMATSPSDSTQLGLAFRPTRADVTRIDIGGTLWLDRATNELRALDFRYAGLGKTASDAGAGGRMDFVHLPGGAWVTSRWEITAPRVVTVRGLQSTVSGSLRGGSSASGRAGTRDSIAEHWRIGGALLRVTLAGKEVWRGSSARLFGRVVDSGNGSPVAGASIALRGTNYAAVTDARGSFAIDDILLGSYDVEVQSPDVALGVNMPIIESIDLQDTTAVERTVHLPSLRTVVERACGTGDTLLAVIGRVEGTNHSPAVGARVEARWFTRVESNKAGNAPSQRLVATSTTDANGVYQVCGVPADRVIRVVAMQATARSAPLTTRIPLSQGLGRVDLQLREQQNTGELWGRVLVEGDTTGLAGARIEIPDVSAIATTSSTGSYRLGGIVPGPHLVQVRQLGYQSVSMEVELPDDHAVRRDINLRHVATLLDEVRIEGQMRKVPARFQDVYRRMTIANGSFFTSEDIERLNPPDVQSLLLRVPMVRVNAEGIQAARCNEGGALMLARGGQKAPSGGGKVQIYIDGLRMTGRLNLADPGAERIDVLRLVNPSQIQAIEVYSGVARIPGEFLEDACAVIAIWTKAY